MKLSLPRRRAVRDPGALSPQLSTYQRRRPITDGPGQAAGRGFEHWISCSRGRLMRHWRRRPARLQRFLRNIKPVSPFVSRPSRWQYVRLLPHLAHVAVKGTSGITPPWERRGPPALLVVGGAAPPGHRSHKWRTPSSILQRTSDCVHGPTASSWSEPTDSCLTQRQVISPQHDGAGCASFVAPVIQQ